MKLNTTLNQGKRVVFTSEVNDALGRVRVKIGTKGTIVSREPNSKGEIIVRPDYKHYPIHAVPVGSVSIY